MKKILIGCSIFIGMIGIGATIMFISLTSNMETIKALEINEIHIDESISTTIQGEYYFEDQIGATVDVTILNGRITEITFIEHICGKGAIAEVIIEDIIESQSLLVDDISGATTSSHVIKLAIQDAMEELQ